MDSKKKKNVVQEEKVSRKENANLNFTVLSVLKIFSCKKIE